MIKFRMQAEWKELERINKEYLDTLDLYPFITFRRSLSDIIYDIENTYDDDPNMPEELQGCVFNCFDDYEIGKYLENRYDDLQLVEEIIENYYFIRGKK